MSATTTTIPSIKQFIVGEDDEATEATSSLSGLLEKRLYGSLVPLLVMTKGEASATNLLGRWRVSYIGERLRQHDLRFREQGETPYMRTAMLCGGVTNAPIQMLALDVDQTGRQIKLKLQPSRAVFQITSLDPNATLGMFLPERIGNDASQSICDKYKQFVIDRDGPVRMLQGAEFADTARSLMAGLLYWHSTS